MRRLPRGTTAGALAVLFLLLLCLVALHSSSRALSSATRATATASAKISLYQEEEDAQRRGGGGGHILRDHHGEERIDVMMERTERPASSGEYIALSPGAILPNQGRGGEGVRMLGGEWGVEGVGVRLTPVISSYWVAPVV